MLLHKYITFNTIQLCNEVKWRGSTGKMPGRAAYVICIFYTTLTPAHHFKVYSGYLLRLLIKMKMNKPVEKFQNLQ